LIWEELRSNDGECFSQPSIAIIGVGFVCGKELLIMAFFLEYITEANLQTKLLKQIWYNLDCAIA
jgi:hypothetical protein